MNSLPLLRVSLHGLPHAQTATQHLIEGLTRDLGLDVDTAHSAGWAAQELVGNALRHATAPILLGAYQEPALVTIAVVDGYPVPVNIDAHTTPPLTLEALDALPEDDPALEHGRGLAAIARICHGRLGCAIWPGCKEMWFALPISHGAHLTHEQITHHLAQLPTAAVPPPHPAFPTPNAELLSSYTARTPSPGSGHQAPFRPLPLSLSPSGRNGHKGGARPDTSPRSCATPCPA